MSKNTLEIDPRCKVAISVKEWGVGGESARICVEVVIIMGTQIIGRRIVLVGLLREFGIRGPMFGASKNRL